jgi:hypothetical protein
MGFKASFGDLLASGPLICNGLIQYRRDSMRQRETEHVGSRVPPQDFS